MKNIIIKPEQFIVFDHSELCGDENEQCPNLKKIASKWYCKKFEFTRSFWDQPRKCHSCYILYSESTGRQ
jgi:hypothetical protein